MFTELLKKGNWSYMFLAALATLAIAALATLFTSRSTGDIQNRANHENEQVITGRYTQFNESSVRFVN
jgi:hypothetical protein